MGAAGSVVVMNMVSSAITNPSPNSAFSMVNQIQILLLLLLLPVYLPLRVFNYIRSLAMSLIDFNIDWNFIIVFRKLILWFDYEQPLDELSNVGLDSGSTFINLADTIIILIIAGIIHVIFMIINCLRNKKNSY